MFYNDHRVSDQTAPKAGNQNVLVVKNTRYEIKKKLLCVKNIVWFRFRTQIKPVRFHALIMVIIIIVEVEVVLY